jgi:hypothetical protein
VKKFGAMDQTPLDGLKLAVAAGKFSGTFIATDTEFLGQT